MAIEIEPTVAPAPDASLALHPLRVLVVDDSAVVRLVLRRGVERSGHHCMTAVDGIDALEQARTFRPHVVISDWEMPRMDGLELCRRIRLEQSATYPYFIFLTALDQRDHVLSAMLAGADDYLEKPLDPRALAAALVAASRVTVLHERLGEQREALQVLNTRLYGDARQDPLTGLGNRLRLREDLSVALETPGRPGTSIALCDIDFFKRYNDKEGHLAGDSVLAWVATAIRDSVRAGDGVYRYGGEEFLILLPGASLAQGAVIVEHIRGAVEGCAIAHPDSEVARVVTISCGLTFSPPRDASSVQEILHLADDALYAAKAAGRNRIERAAPGGPLSAAAARRRPNGRP